MCPWYEAVKWTHTNSVTQHWHDIQIADYMHSSMQVWFKWVGILYFLSNAAVVCLYSFILHALLHIIDYRKLQQMHKCSEQFKEEKNANTIMLMIFLFLLFSFFENKHKIQLKKKQFSFHLIIESTAYQWLVFASFYDSMYGNKRKTLYK